MTYHALLKSAGAAALLSLTPGIASAATVLTVNDGVVRNSLCVGTDCANNPSFSDTTILMMENNTRIKFDDTSATSSFPNNDWEIEANSNQNGGQAYFAINDCGLSSQGGCANDIVFAIEAGARPNALYVDDGGRVGLGISTPAVELHVVDGNTPTLRLDQNASSGFATQVWDVAGNETNFFVRDTTNSSRLPFKIRPGAATNALVIDPAGNVGMGTSTPAAPLDVRKNDTFSFFRLTAATASPNTAADMTFTDGGASGFFRINIVDGDAQEFSLDHNGDLTITGGLVTGTAGSCTVGTPCDAVFDPALYTVPSIEDHAALMWQKKHLPAVGPTQGGQPINMTEKVLSMLNELEHAHIYIEELNDRIKVLEDAVGADKG